jgi:hypothetical protein
MSNPDIRVRLSPEGVKEVIAALRQVQDEAKRGGRAAAGNISLISQAARELKAILPAVGLAAAVLGMKALAQQALKTADATGKLQQKVGGTVEEISGLTFAFRTNESDQEGLQRALVETTQLIDRVRAGSTEAAGALQRIGVDTEAFAKSTAPRALEQIARQLAKIPPGADRAAAAADIFGKKLASELTPALDAVGREGIDPFIEKAREMGLLIDDSLADAAARANDSISTIKLQAEGLATQFVAGFGPQIAGALETFSEAVTNDGTNSFRKFADVVGFGVRFLITAFVSLGKEIAARIAQFVALTVATGEAVKAAASFDFKGARDAFARGVADARRIGEEFQKDQIKLYDQLTDPGTRERSTGGSGTIAPPPDDNAKATASARAAFLKSQLDNELKIQTEGLRAAEAAAKRSYDQGLISFESYMRRRREILEAEQAAELASLQRARANAVQAQAALPKNASEADRIKARQEIASIDAEIAQKQIAAQRELADLEADRIAGIREIQDAQLEAANTIDGLEGRRHAVFERNLQAEIRQLRELGVRAGQTAEEIDAAVERLSSARRAQFNFEEVSRAGKAALDAFTRDAEQIRRDQQAGIISQVEGEQRLIELQAKRLEVLKALSIEMHAAAMATGDPEMIERAEAFADSVDEIAASYHAATDAGAKFLQGGAEAFQQGVQSLLENIDDIHSVGDAFTQLGRTVAQALQKIAAEVIAQQATLAIIRAFGTAAAGAKMGGYVRGYASGGDIAGPQLPIPGPDKVPIMAQKGEFMLRKARVQEPGALPFLRAWNRGDFSLAQALSMPRFAEGGQIGAPAVAAAPAPGQASSGGSPSGVRIVNVVDPKLVTDALGSSEGEQVILNHIDRNIMRIRRKLQGN